MNNDKAMEIRDLRAGYGSLEIVHNVSLTIQPGEFVCLLGPNGAGKSTLLKSLYGMSTVMGGSIRFGGQELAGLKPQQIISHGIAFVPQGRCNFPLMTVAENLEMAVHTRRDAGVDADIKGIYEKFPFLYQRRQQMASSLSGGEQQMLETAMALLRRPQFLLIDEPTMGLSPQTIGMVFRELQNLHAAGHGILLVEQNTKKAMEVAQRAVVLRLGQVIWDGPTQEISHAELGSLFLTGKLPDTSSSTTLGGDRHL